MKQSGNSNIVVKSLQKKGLLLNFDIKKKQDREALFVVKH
jgi:hypothetical protein